MEFATLALSCASSFAIATVTRSRLTYFLASLEQCPVVLRAPSGIGGNASPALDVKNPTISLQSLL